MTENNQLHFRYSLAEGDVSRIRELVRDTGVFSNDEVDIAEELLREGYQKGPSGYYRFIVAEREGNIEGYVCYAQILGTIGSFDVYWVAVNKKFQQAGIGKKLMVEMENTIRNAGGKRIFVETSSRTDYTAARRFYESMGYAEAAILEDFFNFGDHEVVFRKVLCDE